MAKPQRRLVHRLSTPREQRRPDCRSDRWQRSQRGRGVTAGAAATPGHAGRTRGRRVGGADSYVDHRAYDVIADDAWEPDPFHLWARATVQFELRLESRLDL